MAEVREGVRGQPFSVFRGRWGYGGLLSHRTRSGLLQTVWSKVGQGMIRRTHDLLDKVSTSSKPTMPVLSEDAWSNLEVDGQLWRPLPWLPRIADPEWSIVGRRASADIVINDYTVSTHHARIRMTKQGDALAVTDLGSTNGTEADGLILSEDETAIVKSRASVVFGRQEFVFVLAEDLYALLVGDGTLTADSEQAN